MSFLNYNKVVIADNCAIFADTIFDNPNDFNGGTLILGAIFFSFQIYGDFSGYSDMAIGIARLFGFNLMQNFNFPYFSRNVGEFWRRWHISLSTWFRDYLYIPLGGSRGGILFKVRNIFIILIVSGFWHGANWTFIFWGLIHAFFFLPLMINGKNRRYLGELENKIIPSIKDTFKMVITFSLITLAWIFFRAPDLGQAMNFFGGIFSMTSFEMPEFYKLNGEKMALILLIIFVIIEWIGKNQEYAIKRLGSRPAVIRYPIYYAIIVVIFWFGGREQEFIYFQF